MRLVYQSDQIWQGRNVSAARLPFFPFQRWDIGLVPQTNVLDKHII